MKRILLGIVAALCAAPAAATSFKLGDLYYLTQALPSGEKGILRMEPVSGAVSPVYSTTQTIANMFAHDPFRQRLVFKVLPDILKIVDADGSVATLFVGPPNVSRVAAGPNGILYLYEASLGRLWYLDAADALHPVLNEAGTGGFTFGGTVGMSVMTYDAGTQSVIGIHSGTAAFPSCTASNTCVYKIPLDAAGTQVIGSPLSSSVDVSTSAELTTGIGYTNSGAILFIVDTNSNNQEPRMLTVDPATLAISPFASSGPFTGAAVVSAGTYSAVLGRALIVDTFNNVVRAYGPGEVGAGTLLPMSGFSDLGSAELARLIQIGNPSGVTAVDQASNAREWVLEPNLPNPFRSGTTLRFTAPRATHVRLVVYDLSGRAIRTLFDGVTGPGSQFVQWEGLDASGQHSPPGVYFAKLHAAGAATSLSIVRLGE